MKERRTRSSAVSAITSNKTSARTAEKRNPQDRRLSSARAQDQENARQSAENEQQSCRFENHMHPAERYTQDPEEQHSDEDQRKSANQILPAHIPGAGTNQRAKSQKNHRGADNSPGEGIRSEDGPMEAGQPQKQKAEQSENQLDENLDQDRQREHGKSPTVRERARCALFASPPAGAGGRSNRAGASRFCWQRPALRPLRQKLCGDYRATESRLRLRKTGCRSCWAPHWPSRACRPCRAATTCVIHRRTYRPDPLYRRPAGSLPEARSLGSSRGTAARRNT